MAYKDKANEYWDGLIELKLDEYRRFYSRYDSAKAKIIILGGLEEKLARLKVEIKDDGKVRRMHKGPRNIETYFTQINDESMKDNINYLIDHPDSKQIRKILNDKEGIKVAKQISMHSSTYYLMRRNFEKKRAKHTYPHAQFAHYLLNKGYNVKDR